MLNNVENTKNQEVEDPMVEALIDYHLAILESKK